MKRERALKVVLVLIGLLFCASVYPLIGGLLHPADSDIRSNYCGLFGVGCSLCG